MAKQPKEYLTARVSQGLTDEFRASIPEGFQFGAALETIVRIFIALPQRNRMEALTGQFTAKDAAAALVLWETLPAEYRERVVAGDAPNLRALIEEIVDEKIAVGRAAGRELVERPRHKRAAGGSSARGDDSR